MDVILSQRLRRLAPSATLAVAEKARALREKGVNVISFGAGEPNFDTPEFIKQAACAALAAGDTKYPAPITGVTPLRNAVVEYLKRYSNVEYSAAEICATVGAKDAIYMTFATLLDPGDEVIIPAPYWVSYPDLVQLAEGTPRIVKPASPSLKVTGAEIAAALTPRTRVLVLNSPSNPSGAVYSRSELLAIAEVLRGSNVLVISDEIYHRLVFNAESSDCFASLPGMKERTITVNGMSKSFAMTGWRLGFVAAPRPIIDAMGRLQGQTTTGPASFIQTAAAAALSGDPGPVREMCRHYARRGELMWSGLSKLPGVSCNRPEGAFYCFPNVSGAFARLGVADADGFAARVIDQAHVAIVSGGPFGFPSHARLSFATSDENIAEGLSRIARLLS